MQCQLSQRCSQEMRVGETAKKYGA